MDFIWILVPLAPFLLVAALVLVPRYYRSVERQKVAETLRLAIEKGQALPPEVVDAIAKDAKVPPTAGRDLRTGIIWLGVALGLACFGIALGFEEPDATFPLVAIAAFPGFIGLAFLLLGLLNKGKS